VDITVFLSSFKLSAGLAALFGGWLATPLLADDEPWVTLVQAAARSRMAIQGTSTLGNA